jgi:putative tryptophan/tyrosine transport system substrate-binding protein
MSLMPRRGFIALIGGAAAWPVASRAQQPKMPVIGFLASASASAYSNTIASFQTGLNETGYFEGRNLQVEYRWADFHYDRLPALAAELVQRRVAAIFTTGSVISAMAAKSATATIPIVFANGSDPVQYGLVASLNRPGGNVTGINFINSALAPKRLELLRELVPQATIIAVLVNPTNPNAVPDAKALETAGRSLGAQIIVVKASTESELQQAFAQAAQQRANALLVNVDALFNDRGSQQIIALAVQHALPTMSSNHDFTALGGLISYGADISDLNRQGGVYVGRILKGEKPADLPVIQPTTFALRVNLKAAKAIGLTISESFLLRADEVVE